MEAVLRNTRVKSKLTETHITNNNNKTFHGSSLEQKSRLLSTKIISKSKNHGR